MTSSPSPWASGRYRWRDGFLLALTITTLSWSIVVLAEWMVLR